MMPIGEETGIEDVSSFDKAYGLAREFIRREKLEAETFYQRQSMFEIAMQVKKFKSAFKPQKKTKLKLL